MTDRLDRIEAILSNIAERQDRFQQQLERVDQQQDRTQQQIDSNARAIEANSAAIASSRQETTELKALLREEVGNLVTMIVDSSNNTTEQFERIERQFEQDRAERLALSADVRSLVEAMRERFRSNGHS